MLNAPLALYLHWPFCVAKCPYCDFNSHVRATHDDQAWATALLADLAHEAALMAGRQIGSIFFGGGTPSLMPPALVGALIDAVARHWTIAPDVEITLEANPSSVEAARFADLALAGVNRVSLGLQALDDDALRFLGRVHGLAEGLAALDTAQRHFHRVSFDLIYARPHQSMADWMAELDRALALGTTHLSLYQLTIEPGTRFQTLFDRGELAMPDADDAAEMFEATRARTLAAGLPAYEVSNHARGGEESRHNLTYWRYDDYVGVGPGAHGRRGCMATERHRKPENYLSAVARNGHGIKQETPLSPRERADEALMMGLRLSAGVDLDRLAARSGIERSSLFNARAASRLADLGLLHIDTSHIAATPAGMLVLDRLIAQMLDHDG